MNKVVMPSNKEDSGFYTVADLCMELARNGRTAFIGNLGGVCSEELYLISPTQIILARNPNLYWVFDDEILFKVSRFVIVVMTVEEI